MKLLLELLLLSLSSFLFTSRGAAKPIPVISATARRTSWGTRRLLDSREPRGEDVAFLTHENLMGDTLAVLTHENLEVHTTSSGDRNLEETTLVTVTVKTYLWNSHILPIMRVLAVVGHLGVDDYILVTRIPSVISLGDFDTTFWQDPRPAISHLHDKHEETGADTRAHGRHDFLNARILCQSPECTTSIMADDKPSPGQPLDPNNHAIVIQNNYIAEGVTININSSNSYGSKHVAAQPAESTSSQCSLARPLGPVDYGRESVVFNGNTLGHQTNRSSITWTIQKQIQTPNQERLVGSYHIS
ncbi:uncharacterized protein F5891DRAFT_975881 [Suillus fuscotomentosus]|uniref:Uncharacterized protein n=1 Tax=Suillus fuscotomentosus TaxID=1912939 RepID=A0AAD4HRB4_9AGAM|nr:uncharacterized protein F5891DRAFT_975881 [Suillus fuscotomentosus]KAG1905711.1 hypothetical protein F5891DRAFT_975881 [Suillus fuscotomentosus]